MKAGFADGAMARWRTLHEIAVVGVLIRDRGDELARRYLEHEVIESWRTAELHDQHRVTLGNAAIPVEELEELRARKTALVNLYGESFASLYGWAAEDRKQHVNNIGPIARQASLAHWAPYYKLASHPVHGNPKGMHLRLGSIGRHLADLNLGPANVGFAEPAQNTAISLLLISAALVLAKEDIDASVTLKVLDQLSQEIPPLFIGVQSAIERDESRLVLYDK